MDLLEKKLKYINEGNRHVVLSLLNSNYIIRLIKEDSSSTDIATVNNSINFVNIVMIPLIFGNSPYKEHVIKLPLEDVNKLVHNLANIRPPHRKLKSTFSCFAIQAPNLTMISQSNDNYCLEIKPKEGFLSKVFTRYSKCYYCLKQFLKLEEKEVECISNYCPVNLFSGDITRMKKAILNLIQNPQNNLKFFKNGDIVYDEKSNMNEFEDLITKTSLFPSCNAFLDFIAEILLNDGVSNISVEESDDVYNIEIDTCNITQNLTANCFLNKLLSLQKLSEIINLDSIHTNGEVQYVTELLNKIKDLNYNLSNADDRKKFLETMDAKYLAMISAIAKDCSIMICFTQDSHESYPMIRIGDKSVFYRISVTDLEPKSIKTLSKRRKTEQKLIQLYENILKENEVIQPHSETRAKQLEAWQQLISEYLKVTKQSTIDIRESQNSPLFNNASINRKLSSEALLTILEDMAKTGRAASVDKSKNVWEVYWHSLDEWGNMIYNWVNCNGMNNSVCTLFELREGDNTVGEEFHGLDINILIKALKSLEVKGKCELMEFDDSQGVKFF